MLSESEILVDLAFRVPGHACWVYDGIYRGVSRQRRRQAQRDFTAEQKQVIKHNRLVQQILRQIDFPDTDLYNQDQLKEMYGKRLFVTPYMDMCIARPNANHRFLISRGVIPGWHFETYRQRYGPSEALPWPPKSQRKMSRWQSPPNGKKYRQRGGLITESISAVDLFPPEWRVKDAFEDEEEEEES